MARFSIKIYKFEITFFESHYFKKTYYFNLNLSMRLNHVLIEATLKMTSILLMITYKNNPIIYKL